jgi:replicative DNA helicase
MSYKIPPHNNEAELSIIGGIMVEPEAFDLVSDTISAEDFYKSAHQKIFAAIAELNAKGQPADIITISNHLLLKF